LAVEVQKQARVAKNRSGPAGPDPAESSRRYGLDLIYVLGKIMP